MDYRIKFMDADRLDGHEWAICRNASGTTLYLSRDVRHGSEADVCRMLEEAWAGYRELKAFGSQCLNVDAARIEADPAGSGQDGHPVNGQLH